MRPKIWLKTQFESGSDTPDILALAHPKMALAHPKRALARPFFNFFFALMGGLAPTLEHPAARTRSFWGDHGPYRSIFYPKTFSVTHCLLLAKISDFCKYVCAFVCLFVGLFVRMYVRYAIQATVLSQSSPNLVDR